MLKQEAKLLSAGLLGLILFVYPLYVINHSCTGHIWTGVVSIVGAIIILVSFTLICHNHIPKLNHTVSGAVLAGFFSFLVAFVILAFVLATTTALLFWLQSYESGFFRCGGLH